MKKFRTTYINDFNAETKEEASELMLLLLATSKDQDRIDKAMKSCIKHPGEGKLGSGSFIVEEIEEINEETLSEQISSITRKARIKNLIIEGIV